MGNQAPHILIIDARFYDDLADELLKGAVAELEKAGATYDRISVPGVLEIPTAMAMAIDAPGKGRDTETGYDGMVLLGVVIRGETSHYDIVCNESARAAMDLSVEYALPVGNAILTVENRDQAWARARVGEKNKGGFAAGAVLQMLDVAKQLGLVNE